MPGLVGVLDWNAERAQSRQIDCPAPGRYWQADHSIVKVPHFGELGLYGDGKAKVSIQDDANYLGMIGEKTVAGDTEGLLHQAIDDPKLAMRSLDSGFSVCFVDVLKGEATIGVDPFGSFPVFFAETDGALLFSTDLATLSAHPRIVRAVSDQSIFDYLYFTVIPAPHTIYDAIRRIPAGHLLRFTKDGCELEQWYQPEAENQNKRPGDLYVDLRSALQSAVTDHWDEGTTACFLSGGLDSSSVCGLAARASSAPVPAFSIGFPDDDYDEMQYARIAKRQFGLDHHEHYVDVDEIVANLADVVSAFGEPFSNASAISTLICARQASDSGYDRVLAGDGGDELFAGNERYKKQLILHRFDKLPRLLQVALRSLRLDSPGIPSGLLRKAGSYIVQGSLPFAKRFQYNNLIEQSGPGQILSSRFLKNVDTAQPVDLLQNVFESSPFDSFLKRMLYADWRFTLADNDLRKVRVACEMAGVDVRFPMLDSRVVAVAETMPGSFFMPQGKLRGFYKDAFRGILPDTIISKPKHGFGVPVGRWMQSNRQLSDMVRQNLDALAQRDIVNPDFLRSMMRAHDSDDAVHFGVVLWTLFILEMWMQLSGL